MKDRKGFIISKKIKQLLKFPRGSVVWMWHQVYVPVAWKQNELVFFRDAVLSVNQLIQFNNKFMLVFIRMSIDVSNHYVLFLCSFDLYKQILHTITKKCKKVAVAPMFHFMYASYSFTSLRLELLVIELKRPERRNFLLFDQVAFIICEQIYKEIWWLDFAAIYSNKFKILGLFKSSILPWQLNKLNAWKKMSYFVCAKFELYTDNKS